MLSALPGSSLALLIAGLPAALACLGHEGGIPTATDNISNGNVIEVGAGEVFDGGWAKYDRGSGACNNQNEGDSDDAVFLLHAGATLRNVIIGKDQSEGVHCKGHCTLEFVWFEDVCEDAISIVSGSILASVRVIAADLSRRKMMLRERRVGSLGAVLTTPATRSSSITDVAR
ncbi:pectate lyase [Candidatus Bathyarchaeota archaeon]|nr:pectate lyase [Candidatus Bathyarchaeota archaeon]